jgi:hypothetical protein
MPKSCIICSIEASPDVLLQYCARCQSAMYCSKACQRIDWKKQHKQICKLLNVGHGDMQVRSSVHESRKIELKEYFERNERNLREDMKQFFKLFQESTFEASQAVARKMKKIAKRQNKDSQEFLLFHSLEVLARSSNSDMLSWPNSPLLVMLQLVDPNVLSGTEDAPLEEGATRLTLLHHLADLADPFDYSTHENQLILAKQLIEQGANINAVSIPEGETPLFRACYASSVTNLDFVEFLLGAGADPNIQDQYGGTALMYTMIPSVDAIQSAIQSAPQSAPGAAKLLLNWPTTDANITTQSGYSFLVGVRKAVERLSSLIALPDNPEQVQHQFLLQQWIEIEEMLVERGARD